MALDPFIIPYLLFAWLPIPMLRDFFYKFHLLNMCASIYINLSSSMLGKRRHENNRRHYWFICIGSLVHSFTNTVSTSYTVTLYEQGLFKSGEKYYLLFITYHINKCLNCLLILLEYMWKHNRIVLNKTIFFSRLYLFEIYEYKTVFCKITNSSKSVFVL